VVTKASWEHFAKLQDIQISGSPGVRVLNYDLRFSCKEVRKLSGLKLTDAFLEGDPGFLLPSLRKVKMCLNQGVPDSPINVI